MLASVVPISCLVPCVLSPAGSHTAGKRCQKGPGLQAPPPADSEPELRSLEGHAGSCLSSSASVAQGPCQRRRKEREGRPSKALPISPRTPGSYKPLSHRSL